MVGFVDIATKYVKHDRRRSFIVASCNTARGVGCATSDENQKGSTAQEEQTSCELVETGGSATYCSKYEIIL